jgi:hypothetical protein
MRNLLFWIVVTNLFWVEAAIADNNDTSTVSVGGKVVASLEITAVSDLRFGPVAIPNTSTDANDDETAAIITVNQATGDFTVTYEGDGVGDGDPGSSNLPAAPNDPAPAKITVTGEPNFHYVVSLANFGFLPLAAGVFVTVDDPGPQTIPTSGTDNFYLGGRFEVRMLGATTGAKSGTIDVTVTYD